MSKVIDPVFRPVAEWKDKGLCKRYTIENVQRMKTKPYFESMDDIKKSAVPDC